MVKAARCWSVFESEAAMSGGPRDLKDLL